jgi:sulfur relay (sulfurtransferase) DsrC/TusE family protein
VLNEFFGDITVINDQTRSVDFEKVLLDNVDGRRSYYAIPDYVPTEYASADSDLLKVHFYKVLSDLTNLSDSVDLLYDKGLYDTEEDATSMVDSFDRVVQYFREFNDVATPTDSFDRVVQYFRVFDEGTSLSDSFDRVVQYVRLFNEEISSTDSFDRVVQYVREFDEETTLIDSFSRVVQYVRLFNDAFYTSHTTAVDFGKTLIEDPLWVTRDFWANPDYSGTEFAWNAEETIEVAFGKNVSDSYSSSDIIDIISFGKVITDTASISIERPGFVINKVLSETIFASDAKSITTALPTLADSFIVSEDSIISNLLTKTEIATTLDYYNKVLQISSADGAETSEIIFIEDEIPHIDMVGVNESSRMIINKGIGDMLGITDSGIINTQDYVNGDFGSDFVGQAVYF